MPTDCDSIEDFEADNFYYGELTEKLTMENIHLVMTSGIIKFESRHNVTLSKTDVGEILDLWFEHDSNKNNFFDFLIDKKNFENFINEVYEQVNAEKNYNYAS